MNEAIEGLQVIKKSFVEVAWTAVLPFSVVGILTDASLGANSCTFSSSARAICVKLKQVQACYRR